MVLKYDAQRLSGPEEQLLPVDEQMVDGESQVPTQSPAPLIEISEPNKRMGPLPVTAFPGSEALTVTTDGVAVLIGELPILQINRYVGGDLDWQEILRWDIPAGFVGDLHEISIQSSDDARTRYRIFLANLDMNIPTDRQTVSPFTAPWRNCKMPQGTSAYVQVRSTDGTSITVDGMMTGTIRPLGAIS